MTTPVYQILKAINLTNVTLLLTSCLQIWNINFIKLTSFSTLWAVTIIYFLWLVKKHKEKINASKKDVKLLQKFYGEAYTRLFHIAAMSSESPCWVFKTFLWV